MTGSASLLEQEESFIILSKVSFKHRRGEVLGDSLDLFLRPSVKVSWGDDEILAVVQDQL